jgi:nucleotide-binding universal stress UspA family protein
MRKGKGVELDSELRQGTPWQEINDVAEKKNADLIVIGTHGRSGLAHALLGSVAERVIRSAARPVLVIRDPRKK